MNKIFYSLCFIFAISLGNLQSQEKFQINGMLAPSYEIIGTRNVNISNPYTFKYSYNFGAEMKYFLSPKLSSNFGLQFNDRGFRSEIEFPNNGDTAQSVVNISAKYISIPFTLCWNFTPAYRTEIFFDAGITYGFLVGQSFRGKRIPSELGRPDNILFEGVSNDKNNINWFDKNYFGLTGGIGVSRYIQSRLVLTVHPMVSFQMDQLIDPQGPVNSLVDNNAGLPVLYSPKLNSFVIWFKLGYYISDQIENTKKEL